MPKSYSAPAEFGANASSSEALGRGDDCYINQKDVVVSGATPSSADGTYTFRGYILNNPHYVLADEVTGLSYAIFADLVYWYITGTHTYYQAPNTGESFPWEVTSWEAVAAVIAGAGTTAADGVYTDRGLFNGRVQYNLLGESSSSTDSAIVWDGTSWIITDDTGTELYNNNAEDVPLPWDSAVWIASGGDEPVPTVTDNAPAPDVTPLPTVKTTSLTQITVPTIREVTADPGGTDVITNADIGNIVWYNTITPVEVTFDSDFTSGSECWLLRAPTSDTVTLDPTVCESSNGSYVITASGSVHATSYNDSASVYIEGNLGDAPNLESISVTGQNLGLDDTDPQNPIIEGYASAIAPCDLLYDEDLGSTTYNNGSSGVGATITSNDDVVIPNMRGDTPEIGDRVLHVNSGVSSGIYTVTDLGEDGVSPWVLTRATDYDRSELIFQGQSVYILQGSQDVEGTAWYYTGESNPTIGTDDIIFEYVQTYFPIQRNYISSSSLTADYTTTLNDVGTSFDCPLSDAGGWTLTIDNTLSYPYDFPCFSGSNSGDAPIFVTLSDTPSGLYWMDGSGIANTGEMEIAVGGSFFVRATSGGQYLITGTGISVA